MAKKAAAASKSASKSAPKAKAKPLPAKPAGKVAPKPVKPVPSPKEKAKPVPAAKAPKSTKPSPEVEDFEEVEAGGEESEPVQAAPAPKIAVEKPSKKEKKAKKSDGSGSSTNSEDHGRWLSLRDQHGDSKPAPYRMAGQFSANTPLMHPSLGWGFVLSNLNDRLEVLFESGMKVLISNYNPK